MHIPTQAEVADRLRGEDLDEWLALWRTEQGPAKPAALQLMASALPFPLDQSLRVLDVGCGTGDAGRAVHARYPHSRIDCVDRNEFFVTLCGAVHRRDGIGGNAWARDLSEADWMRDLASDYDVTVAVNTVHWLRLPQAVTLFGDIFRLLQPGGVLLLMEPAGAAPPFASGVRSWQNEQPRQHRYEDWRRFWSQVEALIGYDYGFLGEPGGSDRIGDSLSAIQWADLLANAGFVSIDVLLRDAEKVVIGGVRP